MRSRVAATARRTVATTSHGENGRVPPRRPMPRIAASRATATGRAGRRSGSRRRHQHQRQDSAEHHAVADEHAELLEARKIHERQPVERRGRRPHPEEHARRRAAEAVDGRRRLRAAFGPRACTPTYSSTTPSTPRPKSIALDAVAAVDSVAPANPSMPSATTSDSAEGIEPTSTSQGERKTRKSSGRMSASDPTVLRMLSRRITDSVSTAIRCPPAN